MLNPNTIENLKNTIINYIKNTEIFDENYIFTLAKNYAKENEIEISKGEIKTIINNLIIELKNNKKFENIDNETYHKSNIEFNHNPLKELCSFIENDYLI